MVTGGFRTRAGMEAALNDGSTQAIGIGRPDVRCARLRARAAGQQGGRLPSFEKSLVMGRGWLSLNSPFSIVRLISGFGAQGWYYQQIFPHRRRAGPRPQARRLQGLHALSGVGEAAAKALVR